MKADGANITELPSRVYRVLLVDDQKMVRDVLRKILEDYPGVLVVAEAANGLQAIALAAAIKPDVILMDVNMPLMNGIEATKRIKHVPASPVVIGLSINTCTEVAERMKEAGADAFLSKEDGSQHLYDVMKQLVDLRISSAFARTDAAV